MSILEDIQMIEGKDLNSAMRELHYLMVQANMPQTIAETNNSYYEVYDNFIHWGSHSFTYTVGYKLKVRKSESEPWVDMGVIKESSSHNSRKCVEDIAEWLVAGGKMFKVLARGVDQPMYKARPNAGGVK